MRLLIFIAFLGADIFATTTLSDAETLISATAQRHNTSVIAPQHDTKKSRAASNSATPTEILRRYRAHFEQLIATPLKTLSPYENNIKGEHFTMLAYNQHLAPYVIARFGHDEAYEFELNKYAWAVKTTKDWAVLMLIEDNSGALMIAILGDVPYCDKIEKALFEKFYTSRWSCTAVPGSAFAKQLELSLFVLQSHVKEDAAGEKTYCRLSNAELEEQEAIDFYTRKGTLKTTFGELCKGKKIMRRCATVANLEFF